MAMKRDNNEPSKESIKVEGDLGDLQIIEEVSDDDDNMCAKQKDSKAVSSTIKRDLGAIVQAGSIPVFSSVAVTNSENVQFGNNTYFNGPVTIIQSKSGMENASYTKTEDDNVPNDPFKPNSKFDAPVRKYEILTWHKVTLSALCVVVIGGICALILVLRTKTDESSSNLTVHSTTDTSANSTVTELNYEIFPVILITIIILLALSLTSYFYNIILTAMASECDDKLNKETKKKVSNATVVPRNICMYERRKADPLLIAPDHLRIVSRTDWLAQPEANKLDKLVLPAPWVIITHTATESCYVQSQCVLRVRLIQMFHVESRGWDDIGYNFLVGGDGSAYYGRGWDSVGAHTKGYNKYSISIAFIGTFNSEEPPSQQVEAGRKLIELGVALGKIAKDYKLFAHRQLMSTLSPGDKLFNIIKGWPHFVSNLTDVNALVPKGY